MAKDYKDASFKSLLEKLQEESWQLELLISGFAIFGLFSILEPLRTNMEIFQNNSVNNGSLVYKFIILSITYISSWILVCNLLLHVILRGIWIGALGLRYVSGDIDYDTLNYSPKFTKYLQKKVGSFDKYISKLETYCSIIFAIAFLLIFYVLAFTFTIIAIALIAIYILDNDYIPDGLREIIGVPIMLFIVFGMLLVFIDFLTLGGLKRKKWTSKIYFPVYWVFSFITLSFLYRPLVYNFLDNKLGRRLSILLIPIFFIILIASSYNYQISNYLRADNNSSAIYADNENYEDQLIKEEDFIKRVAIPSKVITDPFLKVFITYNENIEDNIFDFHPNLKPKKDLRGLQSDIDVNGNTVYPSFKSRSNYLKAFNDLYNVRIDSLKFDDTEFIVSQSKKGKLGFETYVNLKDLPEGKHLLNVTKKQIRRGDTSTIYFARIPFWHYSN
ncbi:hypothetical protein [Winogradskyella immobilis]|uniref:Uncharacterized protein n=1 Tax=Winogradskyella immobilis TaxID=2816852 RepID=A0ABS8EMS0_9FLAO|nr:hypothetical protein [Winogradskyella immobilis]MCC1484524.1 hypothetical protein [Winogradskyella immobilis]MCG0016616.1 hypothetical protein [Winogradskyella immobilis]